MDSTTVVQCQKCGTAVADGRFFIKDGVATCLSCVAQALPPEPVRPPRNVYEQALVQALEHDAARQRAERQLVAPLSKDCLEAVSALEVMARKMAATALARAQPLLEGLTVTSAEVPAPLVARAKEDLGAVERLVQLAQDLDLLADRVFARKP